MNVEEDREAKAEAEACLSARDLLAILTTVERLHNMASITSLARLTAEAIESLIRTEVVSFTQWSETMGHRTFHSTRWLWTPEQRAAAETLLPSHPLVVHLREHPTFEPVALSDVISDHDWRSHPFYIQVWRDHGMFRSLHLTMRLDHDVIAAVSLDRGGRDFSKRDRQVLKALGPHVVATWKRLNSGRVAAPLIGEGNETFSAAADIGRLRLLGLTPREAEVMHWIVGGKQNREISMILGISLRTVQKHVENMLARFGAENRHALTVQALGSIKDH